MNGMKTTISLLLICVGLIAGAQERKVDESNPDVLRFPIKEKWTAIYIPDVNGYKVIKADLHKTSYSQYDCNGHPQNMTLVLSKDNSLKAVGDALEQGRTLAYSFGDIAGDKSLLSDLFNASFSFERLDKKRIRISNLSSLPYKLKINGNDNVLHIAGQCSTDVVADGQLTIDVMNMWYGIEKHPQIIVSSFIIKRASLDVMSFNIRNGNAPDGKNCWDNRKADLSNFIKSKEPDVIGMQEVRDYMLKDINAVCRGYCSFAVGREDGIKGEQLAVLWKKARFTLKDKGWFWLSDTPGTSSLGWDAKYKRIAVWSLFRDKVSGKQFYFINTHLDNKGAQARQKGLGLIKDRMVEINKGKLPIVLTGDFNVADTDSLVVGFNEEMSNCREEARITDHVKSFNAWGDESKSSTIDYIYFSGFKGCEAFKTHMCPFNGREYLSDHYPITAKLVY